MMRARRMIEAGGLTAGLILAVALGQILPRAFGERLPQTADTDVLALILGDARLVVSEALAEKADDYFHGGVRHPECDLHETLAEDHHDDRDGDRAPEHISDAQAAVGASGSRDPWRWLDQRVHVQEHRHLKGAKAAELLPWFWAACRVSPHNTQAYESGAYVLASMLNRPEEAVRLLEEGARNNPSDPELDFSLGELLLNKLHRPTEAEPWFAAARQKSRAETKAFPASEDRTLLRLRALFYLGYIAHGRGDQTRVRACLQEAEEVSPNHAVVRSLRALATSSVSTTP